MLNVGISWLGLGRERALGVPRRMQEVAWDVNEGLEEPECM